MGGLVYPLLVLYGCKVQELRRMSCQSFSDFLDQGDSPPGEAEPEPGDSDLSEQ